MTNPTADIEREIEEPSWESFRDMAYFDMWAVRPVGSRGFNDPLLFHVSSRQVSQRLVRHLNKQDRLARIGARALRSMDSIADRLRQAGATLPAPEVTGTIEGSIVTGMCIALALVEQEIKQIRASDVLGEDQNTNTKENQTQ